MASRPKGHSRKTRIETTVTVTCSWVGDSVPKAIPEKQGLKPDIGDVQRHWFSASQRPFQKNKD